MKSRRTALLVFFLSASTLLGGPLIRPVAPDTHSFITITVGAGWYNSCVPAVADATVSGESITITVRQAVTPFATDDVCVPVTTAWRRTVPLGLMRPGTYIVRARLEQNGRLMDMGTSQFTVRPAEPFRALPPGAPVSGGTEIRLVSEYNWPTNQVFFGETPVTATSAGNVLYVVAPPHAAGSVDIRVGTQTAPRAFTYYDPAYGPDRSVFEPLLFPIAINGAGAYGSSWVTDNIVSAPPYEPATLFEAGFVTKLARIDGDSASGIVVHAGRGTIASAAIASRIRDESRVAQTAGTSVPVVRENDWRLGTLRLTNIPSDAHSRVTLRIWEDHNPPVSVAVETSVNGRAAFASVETRFGKQPNGLFYSQLDITDLLSRLPSTEPRDLKIDAQGYDPDIRLWALVTVTNNDTQQVTAIWPQ
ncbi:MAG TPA: hypothetical protein VLU46_15335 [Thermoanaerobaculia bacterium]|nr:hypothetical protein [Thermoanaerobaculia bacterium]